MKYTGILRAISQSKKTVYDYSGFNFQHIGGRLYSFTCLDGDGYCYVRGRFKWSPAIVNKPNSRELKERKILNFKKITS